MLHNFEPQWLSCIWLALLLFLLLQSLSIFPNYFNFNFLLPIFCSATLHIFLSDFAFFFPLFFCESNFFFGFSFLFVCSLSLSLSLSLGISLAADALPVPLCLLCTWPMLLQLSASASAYDSPASDDLSSNQSMSFSASNSAQPFPCLDSEPPPRSGAARQVSADRRTGNVSGLILRSGQLVFFFVFLYRFVY